jgi:tetratricopeptide (TPR) repeat protein
MHRVGSRAVMVGFSLVWTLGLAASVPAQEAGDEAGDAAERKVMERFLSVLEKTPRRGTALDRVYGFHVERGTLDALVKRYEDRTKKDPNDGACWLLLGLVESQRGRDAVAVAALREAERVRPDDPLPPYYLGQALVLVGQPDAAADAFERALTRKPIRADLLEIYQALGRVHQRARRTDKALAVWARLEAAFPDDTRIREQVASALAEEDQPAQALARYERLAKDVKDDYRKVQMALEAAELKVRLGKVPEALSDFEALLARLNPDSWLFKEVRRKIEEVFLRNDDLAGLAKYYEGRIAKVPDDVEAMARLGRMLAQLGRAGESRQWLDKAVKLAPSRRDLRMALIEQLVQEKKFAEASAQYEELAKAEPNNPDVIRDWGRLLLRDNSKPAPERKAAAAAVWKRLVGDDVKDPVVIAQVADLFRQSEMTDDAIALYRRAIALAPDASQYREYLGEYYHQLKRPAEALATWREGVAKTAPAQGRLGEVLAGFGYRKEALEPLTEAVKLAPDDFDLRLKLADLLVQLDRPLDALPELAAAGRVSESDEQREAVLEREIRAHQAGGKLGDEITQLKADLDAGKDATAPRWTRLARYYEADAKPAEAVASAT